MKYRYAFFLASACALVAQTIPVSIDFTLARETRISRYRIMLHRSLTGLGPTAIAGEFRFPRGSGDVRLANETGTITFVFNRLDSFDVNVELPNGPGNPGGARPFTANIVNGKGAYIGATGTVSFTLTTDGSGVNTVTLSGSVTAGGRTTAFSLPGTLSLTGFPLGGDYNEFIGSGAVTPGGAMTAKMSLISTEGNVNDGVITFTFSATDSVNLAFTYIGGGPPPPDMPVIVTGGTGGFANASGSGTLTVGPFQSVYPVTGSGSISTRAATVPKIIEVSTAYGPGEIAQNAFIVIKGTNLVPATTSKDGVIWSNAPEFATGKMPTVLQGIGVKVNDVPAYVYFFCSAATNPACASDQLNVLTPLDSKLGNARVTVSNNGVESNAFLVLMRQAAPSFLIFNTRGYVAAVHADGSLIGPTTLYPGASTPARAGEQILVFAVGFGLPTTTLVQGSSTQFGPLPTSQTICRVGTNEVTIAAATLISPGLYQFNLIMPSGIAAGDHLIYCSYAPPGFGAATPAGNLITIE